jgi:hypothetical protein
MVKDEIQNSFGLFCLYIQYFPKFIIFIEELASRVLILHDIYVYTSNY